jgi:hypothetical protein
MWWNFWWVLFFKTQVLVPWYYFNSSINCLWLRPCLYSWVGKDLAFTCVYYYKHFHALLEQASS